MPFAILFRTCYIVNPADNGSGLRVTFTKLAKNKACNDVREYDILIRSLLAGSLKEKIKLPFEN
jgi:hypothetical protein